MAAGKRSQQAWYRQAKKEGWLPYVKTIGDERAAEAGYWFDTQRAEMHCRFFESILKHTRGKMAKKPFKLLPWQREDVIYPLYGWRHRETGYRRFRKGSIWVPKKNGKSTLAGGIVHDALHLSGPRAEAYGFAFTAKQARIVFNEAAAFLKSSDFLNSTSKSTPTANRISVPYLDSFFEAREGEAGKESAEGINPVLVIFDELHVQKKRDLWDAITYACAAQDEALILSISTVGVWDEEAIWWEQYDYAKRVLAGEITDHSFFAYIAQADEECRDNLDMLLDPVQQKKANPSLDEPGCLTSAELTAAVIEAKNSPRKVNNLLRYRFGLPTSQINRIVNMAMWHACEAEDPDRLEDRRAFGGLDLASVEDLTAFVLYFEPDLELGEKGFLIATFWCPEEKLLERERAGKLHYKQWADDGWLRVTPGKRIHHPTIVADLQEFVELYDIALIGYDKWNAEAIVQQIEVDVDVVEVQQTLRGMTIGTKFLLDDIEEKRIEHEGNPVLTWCMRNAAADKRSNEDYIRFDKESSKGKIDGAMASAIARGLAAVAEPRQKSIYDQDGEGLEL
ncbi:terminase large subunit [Bremerella cremea]|uniref:terminase large subunit n=1 Tax=Bremerella cremea TaxID=1031537 RepID=UPI0031E95B1B